MGRPFTTPYMNLGVRQAVSASTAVMGAPAAAARPPPIDCRRDCARRGDRGPAAGSYNRGARYGLCACFFVCPLHHQCILRASKPSICASRQPHLGRGLGHLHAGAAVALNCVNERPLLLQSLGKAGHKEGDAPKHPPTVPCIHRIS